MKNKAEDHMAIYQKTSPFSAVLLGNSFDNNTYMDMARCGVQKASVKILSDYMGLTQELMSEFLHSSFRNIQRKNDTDLLDTSKSERIMELTAFAKKATKVLGSQAAMQTWLQSPLMALDFKKPVAFLDTSFGLNILYELLGRIEHGVYS